MTEDAARHDDGLGALSMIGVHEPGRARDARVRSRCHAALERRRRRFSPARRAWRRRFEPALVATICAGFLFEVLSRALYLYRF